MHPNPTIPSQTITLDGPDWLIATDPENIGRHEKWFDLAQLVGSAELSERWTVFEMAEKTDTEPSAGHLLALPNTLTVGGVATKHHDFTIESGRLDLRELLGWDEQGQSAYVYIPFNVREDGLNTFGIGADWWHKAWIDGEVISDTLATGNGTPTLPTMTDHLSNVQLRKGAHLLIVKFISGASSAVLIVGGSSYFQRRVEVKPTPVPWVIQNIFPGYHGVAWYFRTFQAPANPHVNGRYLLQFGAVDYLAQVWVNGYAVGEHEGGETPFTLDVTDAIRPGQENVLALRVLNPSEERRIDGFILKETCSGCKHDKISSNMVYNSGGIVGAVELLLVPQLRITDLHVLPDWKTGEIRIRADLLNAAGTSDVIAQFEVVSTAGGAPLATTNCSVRVETGTEIVEVSLQVPNHQLWSPEEPTLYRVTAGIQVGKSPSIDQQSVRCGFRDFRFENGYFRLNGKRVFLKGSIYIPDFPITYVFPHDPDLLRRDVSNLKKAGYNLVRIAFRSLPQLLELCDEAGILTWEEHYGSWQLQNSPAMKSRWNASIREVILRDRNHPSLVMWGLLNETTDDPVFKHALTCLPMLRELDPTRLVLLNSGRFDVRADVGSLSNPGSVVWNGKMSDLLDLHSYHFCPISQEEIRWLRTNGKGGSAFQSEYGQCGTIDLPSELAQFKRLGQEQSDDARFFQNLMDGFTADWTRWRLDEIWKRPEDYFVDGHRNYARLKEPGETALRSNPALVAYSSTHLVSDGAFAGPGLTTKFRKIKDSSLFDGARLATSPLRWCLFATPNNIYRGSRVRFEVVLADEDTLSAGEYPARVEILGPDRRPIATREIRIRLEDPANYHERAFATPCFDEEIDVDSPADAYELVVTMSDGRKIPGDRLTFHVDDAGTMPALPPEVTLWDEDAALSNWLTGHGVKVIPFDPLAARCQIIVVGTKPPTPGGAEVFALLAQHIARGSAVVFLDRGVFAGQKGRACWLPLACKKFIKADWVGSYYRAERWNKHHPIFHGLPSGGMMDYSFYGSLISNDVIPSEEDLAKPSLTGPQLNEVVCGATRTSSSSGSSSKYESGLHVAIYELGAGRFTLNTLNLLPNLDKHPAAERLLRNMLNDAAQYIDKPLADLPADFDKQLESMGYKSLNQKRLRK